MSSTVDPVERPTEYMAMVLAHLGSEDPAAVQRDTSSALRTMVAAAGSDIRTSPAEGEWSIIELLGHILDSEYIASVRYRWVIAEHVPALAPYDQDDWVRAAQYCAADPGDILAIFETLRAANLRLWERSTPEQRARVGIHAERGLESYDLIFRLVAGHGRFHIKQMQTTLDAIRAAQSFEA